ncbi:hypothetical protein CC86DRAFT_379017 [Ophiobolus disseminans]|uniref:Uncharacterized protein n=1 Tax=Ophiobolus disseminans TaxID=1469910 RepID=A0A6A7AC15_9PLEO|nr:hypothetical protein CC86DRAFT_379017 [Ophiobolus disseminans]
MACLRDMLAFLEHGQVGRFHADTTIQFNFGVHKQDPVLGAIRATISKLKKEHLHIFEPKFEVKPLDDALPLWPVGRNYFGVKYYTFNMKEDYGSNVTAPVTVFPSGAYPSANTIHLYISEKKEWIALSTWLHTAVSKWAFTGKHGDRLQRGWWKVNGKTFPFLGLPAELRNKVYMYAFESELYPLSTYHAISNRVSDTDSRLTLGIGYYRNTQSRICAHTTPRLVCSMQEKMCQARLCAVALA